jgi:hypothetical protein
MSSKWPGMDAANGNETHFWVGCALRAIEWAVIGAVASSRSLQLSGLVGHALSAPALGNVSADFRVECHFLRQLESAHDVSSGRGPQQSTVVFTSPWTSAAWERSALTNDARPPAASILLATRWTRSAPRAAMTTLAPFRVNASAAARPIPELPPVTGQPCLSSPNRTPGRPRRSCGGARKYRIWRLANPLKAAGIPRLAHWSYASNARQ